MQPLNIRRHISAGAEQTRRDPAPTRMAYRMQRLWLTPLFRVIMRVGVPAFLVVFCVGLYLASDTRRAALTVRLAEIRQKVEHRPEFMVSLLSIEGASPALDAAIRQIIAIDLPQSSFDLDLEAARNRVAALDAVADAELRVKGAGVLQLTITEREPALIWRKSEVLELLDATGRRVAMVLNRADRADLPVIAGEGADIAADEALQIVAATGPLTPRLRGLVRMGERRWDVVLDRNQRVMLPSVNPVRALERLIALDKAEDLLSRDILAVDLRNAERPILRLAPYALRQMRQAKGIDTVENDL